MNHQTSSVLQIAYQSPQVSTQPMSESPLVDSSFAVPVFSPGDDPIACLNKGRQGQSYSGTGYKGNANSSGGNNAIGQARVVKCYNCQGEGHMARQCTQPKQPRNATWYKDKAMLAEAQEAGKFLDEEQLAFLADPGVPDGQAEKANKEHNNESVTAEQERYKERVKTFKQCLNIDLSSREKMIDSQIDDMIKEKLTLKEQVDSLEQNLSKQIKENECLLQTFTVFKSKSKEKEDKYMENEIDLEKKIKKLDNILFKVGQYAQTVHMLTKPQAFYDNIHKQALGYQNPFHLKKAQRIKSTLYDGIIMSAKHVAMPMIDDEETLILEEESRSKMSEKEKDPGSIKQNISYKPIDYEKLNRLFDDFGKKFTPQQELSAEQAFWLRMSNPTNKPSHASPIKIEAPKELSNVSLVNESLKKLKFHLARDLLNEIMEVKTVFDQMDAAVQQSSVDKQCLEIAKKELLLEDRILQQIMSQEVLLTVMNSMSLFGASVNMDGKRKESCNLEDELLKSQNAFNDLLKSYFQLEKQSQLEDKDNTICKLKDIIKSMRENSKEENVKSDYCEIETKNVELKNSVTKLLSENKRLCNEINHVKQIVDIAAQIPSANTIVPGMFKLDLEPLAPRLLQNREAHIDYLKYTQEQADILRGIVKQAKAEQPLYKELDFACKFAQQIQELLVYVRDTCPNAINFSAKKVDVTPKNKVKKVRFAEPLTFLSNIKQVESSNTSDSNTPVLSSTGLKCSTSKCESNTGDKWNDKILQTPSRNMKNKKSMFDGVHDMCLLDFVENVFTEVGLKWKPTGRTFTIVSSSKKAKNVDSKNANHSEPNHTWGSNATDIPSSSSFVMTVRFRNDNIARIMGYGDYQLGNATISKVYYVEGLGHNLFYVG
ncbi:retrovirus-related pol polyprotein from transposon TNT 1-94 [Tanacetum coccineum]